MKKNTIMHISALIAFCGVSFLLLANVIFQSPIQDLNTFAAAVVSVLFLVVGLTIISGCQNPILVRHRLHKAGLYNHEGQAPWLIRQSRDPDNKKIMLLEFENQGIPRGEYPYNGIQALSGYPDLRARRE